MSSTTLPQSFTSSLSETLLSTVTSIATSTLITTTSSISPVPSGDDDAEEPPPEEEEKVSSQALLILVTLLIAALLTSYYLQRWRIRTVHETVLSIFAGMAVGLVVRFSTGSYIQRMVTFDHTIFFNMLLPPIILNCGYNLQKTSIARNMQAVITFAFIGTAISAIVIGILVQIYSFTGVERIGFSLLDSLILGTILSATDPVTILAVFEQLRVDPKLFSIIFGETVFNDAVAIVLFVTLSNLRGSGEGFTLGAVPGMLSSFMFVFTASLLVGVAVGVCMSLLCKYARLYEYPSIEASLVMLMAYETYLFSNAIELSGIVSLLFCAATMRQYAYKSLSIKSKRATRYLFHLLSGLAENFVFIYLGISLFTSSDMKFRPVFIIFVMIATCISRYSAIFPLSRILNAIFKYRHPSAPSSAQPVTHEEQTMLFWAGLRGAVAVALAGEVSGDNGPLLRTTVLCVVVLSVTVFGGTTSLVVQQLGIRTGVPQPDSSDEDEGEDGSDGNNDDDEDEGARSRRRRVIDLSAQHQRRESSGENDDGPSVAVDMDMPAAEPLSSSEEIPMGAIPRSLTRFSSNWNDSEESWFARIKNSYRSFDRSLLKDVDRYYIQPLLIRSRFSTATAAREDGMASSNRLRPRRYYRRQGRSDDDNGNANRRYSKPSSQIRRAYSNSDVEDNDNSNEYDAAAAAGADLGDSSNSWSRYYPSAEAEYNTWAGVSSNATSDAGGNSPTTSQRKRNTQPLLKKKNEDK